MTDEQIRRALNAVVADPAACRAIASMAVYWPMSVEAMTAIFATAVVTEAERQATAEAERARIAAWLRSLKTQHRIVNIDLAAQVIEENRIP